MISIIKNFKVIQKGKKNPSGSQMFAAFLKQSQNYLRGEKEQCLKCLCLTLMVANKTC